MKRLWMLLFVLVGCASPTQPQVTQNYELNFVKDIDTIFVDASGGQVVKHIGAFTNVRSRRMVLISSNIFVRLQEELKKTRREIDDLKLKIATDSVGGGSATADEARDCGGIQVIAKIVDDSKTPEEFRYPHLRKVLAVDTMRVVILPRR